jgi:hypothetical protein
MKKKSGKNLKAWNLSLRTWTGWAWRSLHGTLQSEMG